MRWCPGIDYLIVKKKAIEEKVGGLILPDQPKKVNHKWLVVRAGGSDKQLEGMTIILDGLGGLTLDLDDEEYKIVHKKHMIAWFSGS